MSFNSQWDCLSFDSLALPYNLAERELSEKPRLVSGTQNTCVTFGGKLAKRYGTVGVANTAINGLVAGGRIDRLWVYETMDTPPIVYLVASVYQPATTNWGLYYCRLDNSTPWTAASSYRGCQASTVPHEGGVARGFLYIRGAPNSGTDLLGGVILDGTGGTFVVKPWGGLGPTIPARIVATQHKLAAAIASTDSSLTVDSTSGFPAAPFNIQLEYEILTVTAVSGTTLTVLRGAQASIPSSHAAGAKVRYVAWTTSSHPVVVNTQWQYSYAYESITGNVTSLVATETNPDNLPSSTGPFTNLLPQITLQGTADTTNFPYIRVFRTTDAGGTFFQLDRIANPGAGPFTYTDSSLTSGSGTQDPIPDQQLNQAIIAPTLTSNAPPPTTLAPKVTGVDPVQAGTPLDYYAGRWWYAIGNVLFYSGQEEITLGVPEECFPSGTFGNFFRFQNAVINVRTTNDGLYVLTRNATYIIAGTTLETFNVRPLFLSLGAPVGHPRAITAFSDSICWLTHDYRISISGGGTQQTISNELGNDLINAINAGAEVDMKYWADREKQYVVVSAINKTTPANTLTWIFDILQADKSGGNFWYSPWTVPATCLAEGRLQASANEHSLIFANNFGSGAFLATYDSTGVAAVDTDSVGNTQQYACPIITNLFMLPPGNHINALRRPGVVPIVHWVEVVRTTFPSDVDPTLQLFFDDIWTTAQAVPPPASSPMFRTQSKGYRTLQYPIQQSAQRVALKLVKPASPDRFELQALTIAFLSTLGN